MADDRPRLATCDLGSNSVLLLVVEVQNDGSLRRMDDGIALTRIGRGVGRTGRFDPEAERATLAALERFAQIASDHEPGPLRCVATAGLRDATATERDRFLAAATARGVCIELIDGRREAELTLGAVIRSLPDLGSNLTMIDVGGRSTELVRARDGRIDSSSSVSLGGVGLTEDVLRSDPPTPAEVARARTLAQETLAGASGPTDSSHPVVAAGGTATTIAAVMRSIHPYDADLVHGIRIPVTALTEWIQRVATQPLQALMRTPGLPPGRADIVVGGAIALEAAAMRLSADELVVSDRGLCWGLAYERSRDQKDAGRSPKAR